MDSAIFASSNRYSIDEPFAQLVHCFASEVEICDFEWSLYGSDRKTEYSGGTSGSA